MCIYIAENIDKLHRINFFYLSRIRLLRLFVEGLRTPRHGVSTGGWCAILRRAHELDSTTLDYDIRGWWKILCVTDRIAIA